MCGLLCLIQRGRPIDRGSFKAALEDLRHRGPDALNAEYSTIEIAGGLTVSIALGHTRLAILDPAARSEQPFAVGENRLVYNGEIYNHRELIVRIGSTPESLTTSGDTEVLARLLADAGAGALSHANGMWAFCWLDAAANRLIAGRDRYGKKPLFYAVLSDAIAFASEIRPLLRLLGLTPRARSWVVPAFLAEGWCLPPSDGTTHLEGVREVSPGHVLEFDFRTWSIGERRIVDRDPLSPEPLADEELAGLFADAVESRLLADRKVGLLLSGGVDSSLILSSLARTRHARQVTCLVGDAGKSDDARIAAETLKALDIPSIVVPLDYTERAFDDFLAVCRHQEKPFPLIGNVLGLPRLYAAAASQDVRVLLDGTGADELFGGYWRRYARFAVRDAERHGDRDWLRRVDEGGGAAQGLTERPHLTDELLAYVQPDVRSMMATQAPRDPLTLHGGTLPEALDLDIRCGRLPEWLWQNDRNAMAASTENRSPFLDTRLARAMCRSYVDAFVGPYNKPRLRRLFEAFRPVTAAARTEKQGFRWVYSRFFRTNRERILDLLLESKLAAQIADTDAIANRARGDDTFLASPLMHRLVVLAGLERVCALAPG